MFGHMIFGVLFSSDSLNAVPHEAKRMNPKLGPPGIDFVHNSTVFCSNQVNSNFVLLAFWDRIFSSNRLKSIYISLAY